MDRADMDHAVCAELLSTSEEPIVVPAPVVVELDWLTGSRLGPTTFAEFLIDVEEGSVRIIDLTQSEYARARELCLQYSDLPLGFVDASVIVTLERFKEETLATLDHRHFRVVRPRHVTSLTLIPKL